MHNIHFVRVKADNMKEACNIVEREIEDWGTENNWRHICGAVSKNGKTLNLTMDDDNGFSFGRWIPSLKYVKETMNDVYSTTDEHYKNAIDKLIANKKSLIPHEWWCIQRYAEDQYAKGVCTANGKFDIWKHEYRECGYDECGLTDMNYIEGKNQYIVFVDMHS